MFYYIFAILWFIILFIWAYYKLSKKSHTIEFGYILTISLFIGVFSYVCGYGESNEEAIELQAEYFTLTSYNKAITKSTNVIKLSDLYYKINEYNLKYLKASNLKNNILFSCFYQKDIIEDLSLIEYPLIEIYP